MNEFVTVQGVQYSVVPPPHADRPGRAPVNVAALLFREGKYAGQVVVDSADRAVLTGPEFTGLTLWDRLLYGQAIRAGGGHVRVVHGPVLEQWWCCSCDEWIPAGETQVVEGPHGVRNHTVPRRARSGVAVLVHHTVCADKPDAA